MRPASTLLTCRLCGHVHQEVALAPGERALCANCQSVLARRGYGGPDAALAFCLTGLILAVPSALLPLVRAEKVGHERGARLMTGIEHLWHTGMRLQAIPVFLFGALLPLVLLVILAGLLLPRRLGWNPWPSLPLAAAASALRRWAMPEVQVLAVLVAMVKLGSLITITIGPGFWCYAAMSLALLLGLRSYDLDTSHRRDRAVQP